MTSETKATSLHDQIMNIPGQPGMYVLDHARHVSYIEGHRDARHAAAELASQYEATQDELVAQLVAALEDAREWVSEHAFQMEGYECGMGVRENIKFIDAALTLARTNGVGK